MLKTGIQKVDDLLNLSDEGLLQVLKRADNLDNTIAENHELASRKAKSRMGEDLEIVILGSSGCRFGMLHGQAGGVWIKIGGQCFLIDPGPSAISILSKLKEVSNRFLLGNIDGILCSHLHADHVGNLIHCIEGMTLGAKVRKGLVVGNRTVIEGFVRLYPHHFSFVSPVILNQAALEGSTKIEDVEITVRGQLELKDIGIHPTPTKHLERDGSLDTGIGFFLRTIRGNIWYTSDTQLFEGLLSYIKSLSRSKGVALVIANADASNIVDDPQKAEQCHLVTRDVLAIARELKPKYIIINHYDEAYSSSDYKLAQVIYLNRELSRTGLPVKVVPSTDGLSLTVNDQGVTKAKFYFGGEDASAISHFLRSMEIATVDDGVGE